MKFFKKDWQKVCVNMVTHPVCKNTKKKCTNLALGGNGEHGLCQSCLDEVKRNDIKHI